MLNHPKHDPFKFVPARAFARAATFGALALSILCARPALAQEPNKEPLPPIVNPFGAPGAMDSPAALGAPGADKEGRLAVLVEMTTPSAGEVYVRELAAAGAADGNSVGAADVSRIAAVTQAQVATITAEQQALLTLLESMGAQQIYSAQRVYNGVAVRVSQNLVDDLASLPGVKAIHRIVLKYPTNDSSIPFLGVPQAWGYTNAPGLHGEGIRIGIIDTGVDYMHTDFGGPGLTGDVNNPRSISDLPYYPGTRVVGGYDLAGETYDPDPWSWGYDPFPDPDADPIDCYGHGTHVAGTAAGNGTFNNGAPYFGPYTAGLDYGRLDIGPGVAPAARIYAIKVFSCAPYTELVDAGIEWAVDPNADGDFSDRLDVVNLSVGSLHGSALDPTSMAADRAAQIGVIVVASAGNSGDIAYVTGSPAASTYAISVAASADTLTLFEKYEDTLAYFSSRGPRRPDSALKPDIAAPGVAIASADNNSGHDWVTASGTSMAAPHITGIMALLRQQFPTASVSHLKAVLMNTAAPVLRVTGEITSTLFSPVSAGAGRVNIYQALRTQGAAYDADNPAAVSLNFGTPEVDGSYSAVRSVRIEEPGQYRAIYAPVLDVPGVDILLPSDEPLNVPAGGTLLPVTLSATAANMRNALDPTQPTFPGYWRAWEAEESGHLWLWPLPTRLNARLAKMGLPVLDPSSAEEVSATTADFTFGPGGRTLFANINLGAISPGTVREIVLQRGPAAAIDPTDAYVLYDRTTMPALTSRFTTTVVLSEFDMRLLGSSYLHLVVKTFANPNGALQGTLEAQKSVLKVPVYAAPRPVSTLSVTTPPLDMGTQEKVYSAVTLAGGTLAASNAPTSTQAMAAAFELHVQSPRKSISDAFPTPPRADIEYVGVTSDYHATRDVEASTIYFAVTTYEPWNSLTEVFFTILIDVNNDNTADFRAYTTNQYGYFFGPALGDAFAVAVQAGDSFPSLAGPVNFFDPNEYNTGIFNSNVVVIPVPASLLELDNQRSSFRYSVTTTPVISEVPALGDSTPTRRYDLRNPALALGLSLNDTPFFLPGQVNSAAVAFSMFNYSRSDAQGVLVIMPHNRLGERRAVLPVTFTWPFEQSLPLIQR